MANGNDIVKALQTKAFNKGKDLSSVFTEMLDTFIDFLSYDRLQSCGGDEVKVMETIKDNDWFDTFEMWLEWTNARQRDGKVVDAFDFYESAVKSKGKADMLGQFYTPQCICDMMGEVVYGGGCDKDVMVVNDCSVGSGRTLLGFANIVSVKKQPNVCYYLANDIDAQSVKMCALNLAINGLLGRVIHGDSLQLSYYGGYEVNEVKYPFHTDGICIRQLPKPQSDTPQEFNSYNSVGSQKMAYLDALYQCRIGNPSPCIEYLPENTAVLQRVTAEAYIITMSQRMAEYYNIQPKKETPQHEEPKVEKAPPTAVNADSKNWVQLSLFD